MKNNRLPSIVIGLCLVLFSFYLLISLLTKLDATTQIVNYWPAFLILVGVLTINPSNPNSNGVSMGIIGLGFFGLVYRMGVFQTEGGKILLAMLLGFTGLVILLMVVSKPRKQKNNSSQGQSYDSINRSNRQ